MNQYFIIALVISWIACVGAGWEARNWYDKASQEKAEVKVADSLGKGEVAIIKVNEALNNDQNLKKDSCGSKPIPASVRSLLH